MAVRTSALRRTTLAAIAEVAGVSMATASKVLNGRSDVAPATRRRVEELLVEHDYVPRPSAGTATTTRPAVELLFTSLANPLVLELIRGACEEAAGAAAEIVIGLVPDFVTSQHWMRSRRAPTDRAGVVLVSRAAVHCRRFAETGLPVVLVCPESLVDENVMTICATDCSGGAAATRHLVELGHRRIAIITGRPDATWSKDRLAGYHLAMRSADLVVDPAMVRAGDFSFTSAHQQATELLLRDDPPTAIFACSDRQAFGVLEAARQQGVRVPDDLSVVGFDDLEVSAWSAPPLTTIRQPFADMASLAVQQVLTRAGRRGLDQSSIALSTQLVIRESTSPPRAR